MAPARTCRITQPASHYKVPAPRECDAIGEALRGAFSQDRSMPDGITEALVQLHRIR